MKRTSRGALPHLTIYSLWGSLELDGRILNGIRPQSRTWRLLEALARNAPRSVTTDALFSICAAPDAKDLKGAVHNVVRRLREALRATWPGMDELVERCDGGGWRLAANATVLEPHRSLDRPRHNLDLLSQ
jgi:DNA-binding response OmpR family regulator